MPTDFVHKLSPAAKAHAKEVLGDEQYKANKDAVQSVGEPFDAGADWFRQQVTDVLSRRRDEALARFTTHLQEEGPDGPTEGAEAGEEISKIAKELGLNLK